MPTLLPALYFSQSLLPALHCLPWGRCKTGPQHCFRTPAPSLLRVRVRYPSRLTLRPPRRRRSCNKTSYHERNSGSPAPVPTKHLNHNPFESSKTCSFGMSPRTIPVIHCDSYCSQCFRKCSRRHRTRAGWDDRAMENQANARERFPQMLLPRQSSSCQVEVTHSPGWQKKVRLRRKRRKLSGRRIHPAMQCQVSNKKGHRFVGLVFQKN